MNAAERDSSAGAIENVMDVVGEHSAGDAIEIAPESFSSPVARALVAALNQDLRATYPEPGATHFRLDAEEVAPGVGIFMVARLGGRPVGCGALRCVRDPALMWELGPMVGELKRMYVARDERGKGIGRALLLRLEAEARALGLNRLVLETGNRSPDAIALYRNAGFAAIPAYGEYLASPETSVCLGKEL
jgi:GNAT superfamily N-acetyltransferase